MNTIRTGMASLLLWWGGAVHAEELSPETHRAIRHPAFDAADFLFDLPEGTARKKSLFDHMDHLDMDKLFQHP